MEAARSHQVRYYITFGAPPTRTQADGSEPFMRAEAGFTPRWYRHYCGLDFGEEWHSNPDVRLRGWEKMRNEVRRRFPGRNLGGSESDAPPDIFTGTFGGSLVSSLFGQGIRFWADNWPASTHEHQLTDEEADSLQPPDLEKSTFFQGILKQMDRIQELTGTIVGYLNLQGVLNTAFRLRGNAIFTDMIDNPDRARHIFDCVTTTQLEGYARVYARQREAGVDYRFGTTANCVVNMVSPRLYEEFLLPFDLRLRAAFENFGIHNCAWKVDPYLKGYARVPNLGYLDMGLMSNLPEIKRLFPDARRNLLYTAMDMTNKTDDQIRADFEKIACELGPCDLGLPNLEPEVSDERICFALDLCRELSERYSNQQGIRGQV
jgi:hypothetical protein